MRSKLYVGFGKSLSFEPQIKGLGKVEEKEEHHQKKEATTKMKKQILKAKQFNTEINKKQLETNK